MMIFFHTLSDENTPERVHYPAGMSALALHPAHFVLTCPHCGKEQSFAHANDTIRHLICPTCSGQLCVFVRKPRFELLFDLGTAALLSGHHREAVGSFASALERSFEFYVRAAVLEASAGGMLPLEEVTANFADTWKLVDRQSERQIGMLALAYLLRENKPPDFLKPQRLGSELRNAVLHRGHLPSQEEVEEYASGVFGLIDEILEGLGEAVLHPLVEEENRFAKTLAQLPPEVAVVFVEQKGVFAHRLQSQQPHGQNERWPVTFAQAPSESFLASPLGRFSAELQKNLQQDSPTNDAKAAAKAFARGLGNFWPKDVRIIKN